MMQLINVKSYDFSNAADFGQVADRLGGDAAVKRDLPLMWEAMINAAKDPQANDRKTLYEYVHPPKTFTDAVYIGHLRYDPLKNCIESAAVFSYTKRLQAMCMKYTLTIQENGKDIRQQCSTVSGAAISYQSAENRMEKFVPDPSKSYSAKADIDVLMRDEKELACMKEFHLEGFLETQTPVSSIDVADPSHRATPPDSCITVAYGRGCEQGEVLDYSYPDIRLIPYEKTNVQPLFLPVEGTVHLIDSACLDQIQFRDAVLYLDNGRGTCPYKNTINIDTFKPAQDKKSFHFSFDYDWKNFVPSDRCPDEKPVDFTLYVPFTIENDSNLYTAEVRSNFSSGEKESPDCKKISQLKFLWGCLAAGTMVTMADGSQKKIEEIRIGEHIRTRSQSARVTNCWTGFEETLLKIVTESGRSITASAQHPMLTETGAIAAGKLNGSHRLLTEDGGFESIQMLYSVKGGPVYNLSLEPEKENTSGNTMICSGFVIGDNDLQNSLQPPMLRSAGRPDPALLRELKKLEELL